MTGDDSTDDTTADDGDGERDATADDRVAALEATVESLTERVAELERTVAWMARQQAAETGTSVCPDCNSGGTLRVSRTPTGKKKVECANCGERFD